MAKKMLSFSPSTKHLDSGHRPYNIDKALAELGIEMHIIENWIPLHFRPIVLRVFTPAQIINRLKYLKFLSKKNEETVFIVHGIQLINLMKKLKRSGIPIILDFRDDPLLQAELYNIKLNEKIEKRTMVLLKHNFEYADLILFPSKTLMNYYPQEVQDKGIVVMNASDPNHFLNSPLPKKIKIGYVTGSIEALGNELLLDACKIVKKSFPDIEVNLIYRKIAKYEKYTNWLLNKYNYDWIKYIDPMPYSDVKYFYQDLYLSLNLEQKTFYGDAGLSLKVFDTMASARPIIVTDLYEQANLVNNEKCGLVCEFTSEDLAEKIMQLIEDRNYAEKLGQNGRKAIEERHSWKHRAQKIINQVFN